MSNYSTSEGVIPFANNRKSNGADQLTLRGRALFNCCTKQPDLPKQIADMPSTWRRNSRTSFARQKNG